jgi:mannose-6-phosphate isomerase-like protein (cupin superfamily)
MLCNPETTYQSPAGASVLPVGQNLQASVAVCSLKPGQITECIQHKTVEEIWYILEGEGELFWKNPRTLRKGVLILRPGTVAKLSTGLHFQYRDTGSSSSSSLKFLCITTPPWPGSQEATQVDKYWSKL